MFAHHLANDIYAAIEADDVQDSLQGAKYPLPPVAASHTRAGFVGMDHRTFPQRLFQRSNFLDGSLPGTVHDLVDPARDTVA
jgi:hypothetical protein